MVFWEQKTRTSEIVGQAGFSLYPHISCLVEIVSRRTNLVQIRHVDDGNVDRSFELLVPLLRLVKIILHEPTLLLRRSSADASVPSNDGQNIETSVVLEEEGSREGVEGLESDVTRRRTEEGDSSLRSWTEGANGFGQGVGERS